MLLYTRPKELEKEHLTLLWALILTALKQITRSWKIARTTGLEQIKEMHNMEKIEKGKL